jgi:hypothetical protein
MLLLLDKLLVTLEESAQLCDVSLQLLPLGPGEV